MESLGATLSTLAGTDADLPVALDTEADSFHHYFEKVCLLQLGLPGRAFIVDPLASLDLAPLLAHLATRPLLLHGADYDLRLLFRGHGFRARAIFDTMIAAQLVGERELGLAALLKKRAGVELDKSNQRADWSQRPLSPSLVAYAAEDVLHLHALSDSLREELSSLGRLAWHEEECARLVGAPFSAKEKDEDSEWRLKGTNAMTDRERAFVRAFWAAREKRARTRDVPPFRILPSDLLLKAARLAAAGEVRLEALFATSRPLAPALLAEMRAAFEEARALPASDWPGRRRGERPAADPTLEREVNRLKELRDGRARALGLDPGVLASRALLAEAARAVLDLGRGASAEAVASATGMSVWRAELLFEKKP